MADEREDRTDSSVRVSNTKIYEMVLTLRDGVYDVRRDLAGIGIRMEDQGRRLGDIERLNVDRSVQDLVNLVAEHNKRIRSLELRFYGILAGLIGALAVLLKIGGVV